MGSLVEINDTLQVTTEQGFPSELLDLDKHVACPIKLEQVADQVFTFHDKPGVRIFQSDPVRVYLVHNIDGKWLFWGKAYIQSQSIAKKLAADGSWKDGDWVTSGTYKIVDIYEPGYQEAFTLRESPPGKSFFEAGS